MSDCGIIEQRADLDKDSYWIWTIQLAKWRIAKRLNIPLFDITVKSGIQEFSPTWEMLRAYKDGKTTTQEYERLYKQKILYSMEHRPELWRPFLDNKNIALGCYCQPGVFCHRLIFADILTKYLCDHNKEVTKKGELIDRSIPLKPTIVSADTDADKINF